MQVKTQVKAGRVTAEPQPDAGARPGAAPAPEGKTKVKAGASRQTITRRWCADPAKRK